MEEHVDTIRSYLPVEFKEQETNDYIAYLVSAYLENLQTEKFQFSFTAFHMLYMSYIYKTNWFLKENGVKEIQEVISKYTKDDKYKNAPFNTLFDLSIVMESTSLSDLLKCLQFHTAEIENAKHHVTVRNNCSHAVGKIIYEDTQIENYILEELKNVEAINKKTKIKLKDIFEKFLEDTWNTNWLPKDVRDWIIGNYLSQKDLEEMLKLKITFLKEDSDRKEIVYKKLLYSLFVYETLKYIEEKGEYFINSLIALMKGLPDKIDTKINPDDKEKPKNTQELIEENIVPLIVELSNDDREKAQKILKLV